MSKPSKKEQAVMYHKLAVLSSLMSETIDDIKSAGVEFPELVRPIKEVQQRTCLILTEVFQIESVRSSTYLTDLGNKVDTIIRKNFKDC